MLNHKVSKLLRRIPKDSTNRFHSYLQSPIFSCNSKASLLRMYEVLLEKVVENPNNDFSEEQLYFEIYPDQDQYSRNTLRDLKKDLINQIVEFAAFEAWHENSGQYTIDMLKGLNRWRMDRVFDQKRRKAKLRWEAGSSERNSFSWLAELEMESARFAAWRQEHIHECSSFLISASQALENSYALKQLQLACGIVVQQSIQGTDSDYQLPSIPKKSLSHPQIQIYHRIYKLFTKPTEVKEFQELMKMILFQQDGFPQEEVADWYRYALNYCIDRINNGEEAFRSETQKIYEILLDWKVLLKSGWIHALHFKNIVSLVVAKDSLSWVKKFVKKYGHRILGDEKENAINYALGVIAFQEENFRLAMQYFETVLKDFENEFYGLDARGYQLKCCFALQEFDMIDSIYNSNRQYVKRRHVSDRHKERFSEFNRLVNKLVKIRLGQRGNRQQRLDKLAADVQAHANVSSKSWLLKVIRESEA